MALSFRYGDNCRDNLRQILWSLHQNIVFAYSDRQAWTGTVDPAHELQDMITSKTLVPEKRINEASIHIF